MSTQLHFPKVVAYTKEIAPDGTGSHETFKAIFEKHYPSASFSVMDSTTKSDAGKLAEAEVLITDPALIPDVINIAKKLKWVQFTFAGYDPFIRYVQQTKKSPTYRVTRQGGTYGAVMAEYVTSYIIAHERRVTAMQEDQKSKQWRHLFFRQFRTLHGLTIGLVGAGDIGCEIAQRCKAFGMRTIGLVTRKRSEEEKSEFIDEYRLTKDLDYLLSESDFICNILPSNPNTVEFFKEDVFQSCTKKPLFINVGRGDAVKSSTIIKSIQNGWLCGAVLDVTDPEPPPPESPLWDTPQVTITPHISGIVPENILVQLFLRNYDKFVKGEQMEYEVDVAKLC